jgi:hypothetical protein
MISKRLLEQDSVSTHIARARQRQCATTKGHKTKKKGNEYHGGATPLVPRGDLSDSRTRFSPVRTSTSPFDQKKNESLG